MTWHGIAYKAAYFIAARKQQGKSAKDGGTKDQLQYPMSHFHDHQTHLELSSTWGSQTNKVNISTLNQQEIFHKCHKMDDIDTVEYYCEIKAMNLHTCYSMDKL